MVIITKSGQPLLYEKESYVLRGIWMDIYNSLGPGHKEIVYGNAFEHTLRNNKIPFIREPIISLIYDGKKVGTYRPDFITFNEIIVEFKSLNIIPQVFYKKIYQYLKSSQYKLAFIVNFGTTELQIIRRIYDIKRQKKSVASACNPYKFVL
ncbi:MAG: GxxExxY protein [Patescibacteria group bacterium]|jgi:GxxExxY protein